AATTEFQSPEVINRYRVAVLVLQRPKKFAADAIECVDVAVSVIVAYQQGAAKRPEILGCESQPPGAIQLGTIHEAAQQPAVFAKHIDESTLGAEVREGHEHFAADVLHVVGNETGRNLGISQAVHHGQRAVKNIDTAVGHVGCVEELIRGGG